MSGFRRYAVTIEGLPYAFVESGFPTSELSAWPNIVNGLHDISEGEASLDLGARRQMGNGFSFKVRDPNLTMRNVVKNRADPVGWLVESELPANNTAISFVEVNDPAAIPTTFFLGFETLSYNGTSGSDIANVSRALYDSDPQRHFGSPNDGAGGSIYDAPPRWTGRRVTLWRSTRDAAGNMGAKQSVVTTTLEDPPAPMGNEVWVFYSASLAQWFDKRTLLQGLKPVGPPDSTNDFATTVTLDADAVKQLWDGQSHPAAVILWEFDDGAQWFGPIDSSTSTTITIDAGGPIGSRFLDARGQKWSTATPMLVWEGDPVDITLSLLVSRLGDGTLGTWDVLPGRESDAFNAVEFFAGAQIAQTDVDVDAFASFRGAGPGWTVVLDSKMTVGELLREFCQAVGAYWYVNSSGQLTVARLQERVPPSTSELSITDAIWSVDSADALAVTEQTVFHTVRFEGNYDPVSREHKAIIDVVDAPARREAPFDDRALELQSRFVHVDVKQWGVAPPTTFVAGNPVHRLDLETQLRRIQQYSKRPSVEVVTDVPINDTTDDAVPGAVIDITNGRIPDLKGSTLDGVLAIVIGRQPNREDDTYRLRCRILDNGFLFAPSMEVTSVFPLGGSNYAVVVDATSPWLLNSSPGEEFAAGWTIEDTMQSWEADVTSAGVAAINMTMISGTPSVGDIIIPTYSTGESNNDQGYNPEDFTYLVNDAGSSAVKTRWS